MEKLTIEDRYNDVCKNVTNKQLAKAFSLVEKMLAQSNKREYVNIFEKQKETYKFLLKYTFKGINDPERPNVFRRIQKDLIELAENVKHDVLLRESTKKIYSEKRILNREISRNNINLSGLLNNLSETNEDSETENRKTALSKLFFYIWLNDDFNHDDVNALRKFSRGTKLFAHEKCVIVSSLTISILQRFDLRKFDSLFDFYDANEQFVWNRALIGLILACYKHDKRIEFYPEIVEKVKFLSADSGIEQHIEYILLQFIRTKETKKITRKLREEIIPDMMKFQPKIEKKLNLDKILSDSLTEDRNPDWEKMFQDAPGLLDKMAEFSKLQLDGSDVFMSAFSMLKNFPFFKETANWFLPFYKENKEVKNAFENENKNFNADAFASGLERSVYICNSDKYSFCLNIKMLPARQKNVIIELFKTEAATMEEFKKEDKLLNKEANDKHIFIRYIQDLYRFFKLHPWREEFEDIFESKLDIHNTLFFREVMEDDDLIFTIAELNFEKKYYEDTIDTYLQLDLKGKYAKSIYEKIGFSFQKLQNYEQAHKYYSRAELYDDNSLWLIKKIAFCYRKQQQYEKALEYYKKAEEKQPENLHIQVNIAYCFLSSEKHEEALNYYYKVEYYDPGNEQVMRPLAWCLFFLGKFEKAVKYYKKIIKDEPTGYDFINYGHVLFCMGKKQKAVKFYRKSLKYLDENIFEESINDDRKILLKHGADNTDVNLLIDYIKMY